MGSEIISEVSLVGNSVRSSWWFLAGSCARNWCLTTATKAVYWRGEKFFLTHIFWLQKIGMPAPNKVFLANDKAEH